MTDKVIAFTRPDGGTSIVNPAPWSRRVGAITIDGERIELPAPVPFDRLVAQYGTADLSPGWAETEPDFLARVIARSVPADARDVTILDRGRIPPDRTFRDAWSVGDSAVLVDMPKARAIHLDRVRAVRNKALAALDVDYLLADEKGDAEGKQAIAAEKQRLRDLPATLDLGKAATPDALARIWPEGLPALDAAEPASTKGNAIEEQRA